MKKLFTFICVASFLLITSLALADLVILTNGQRVEGKVVGQTENFVRIKPYKGSVSLKEFLVDNVQEVIIGDSSQYQDRLEILEEVIPTAVQTPPKQDPVTNPVPPPEEVVQDPAEVWTNDTMDEFLGNTSEKFLTYEDLPSYNDAPKNTEEALERVEKITTVITQNQGGQFSPQDMDQESMDALVVEMQKGVKVSMKDQFVPMLGFFAKMIGGFFLFFGLIAFIINRFIDEDNVTEFPKAGFWRRFLALNIDSWIGGALIGSLITILGLLVPLDSKAAVPIYCIVFLFAGIYAWYFVFGCVKFSNTYGRYVMNVKIVDYATGEKPRYKQAFVRSLGFIFWPIEGILLMISKSKRRLGDAWAGTRVIVTKSNKGWLVRAQKGILILFIGYGLCYIVMPIALNKMHIVDVTRQHIEQKTKIIIKGNPQGVQIDSNPQVTQGFVTFKLDSEDGRSIQILLERGLQGWEVRDKRFIKRKFFGLITINY